MAETGINNIPKHDFEQLKVKVVMDAGAKLDSAIAAIPDPMEDPKKTKELYDKKAETMAFFDQIQSACYALNAGLLQLDDCMKLGKAEYTDDDKNYLDEGVKEVNKFLEWAKTYLSE